MPYPTRHYTFIKPYQEKSYYVCREYPDLRIASCFDSSGKRTWQISYDGVLINKCSTMKSCFNWIDSCWSIEDPANPHAILGQAKQNKAPTCNTRPGNFLILSHSRNNIVAAGLTKRGVSRKLQELFRQNPDNKYQIAKITTVAELGDMPINYTEVEDVL